MTTNTCKILSAFFPVQSRFSSAFSAVQLCVLLMILLSSAPADAGNLFLWKVKSEKATVHLFGSIHFAKQDLYPLDPAIESSFKNSDRLVVEVNLNAMNPLLLTQTMMSLARYPEGLTLAQSMNKEKYRQVESRMSEIGMDLATLQQFEPWFVAMMVMTVKLANLGFEASLGLDKHFLDQAEKVNKPVLELETADFQLRLLDSFSREEQDDFLVYTLVSLDETEKELDHMIQAWKEGNSAELEKIFTRSVEENPSFQGVYDRLINDRNRTMTDKIEGYLDSGGSYFVVVGSGHLVGEKGIVELLRSRGYEVEQVTSGTAVAASMFPPGPTNSR